MRTLISSLTLLLYSLLATYTAAQTLQDTLVLTEEYPPYNYLDEQGNLQGIAVDLLERAYRQGGVSFDRTHIRVQPWPRSYRQVQKGSNVMLFSMTRTPAREALFQWAGPISKTKVVLLAKRGRGIKIDTVDDLSGYVIGGIHNDIGVILVHELLNYKAEVLTTPHASSLAKMLHLKRIDLWAYEENAAKLFIQRSGFDPENYEAVYTLSESELYYAFSLNTPASTVEQLQRALDSLKQRKK
ncbi:MAG: substrate-binding periplasmic protein [Pseudomonadales bacterium]